MYQSCCFIAKQTKAKHIAALKYNMCSNFSKIQSTILATGCWYSISTRNQITPLPQMLLVLMSWNCSGLRLITLNMLPQQQWAEDSNSVDSRKQHPSDDNSVDLFTTPRGKVYSFSHLWTHKIQHNLHNLHFMYQSLDPIWHIFTLPYLH